MALALPHVTVVIPTHDRERMLFEHALPSALGQRGVNIEVVVVCDGSTVEFARRVEGVGDPRVKVIRCPTARGVANARNMGVQAATTDWVAILDDDDLWAPRKVAEQVAAAERAGAGFAYSAALIVDAQFRVKASVPAPDPETLLPNLLAMSVVPGGGSNILARRDVVGAVGGFDSEMWYGSEWDMAIRLSAASIGAAVPEPLVAWVRHEGATAASMIKAREDIERLSATFAGLSQRHNVRFDEAATLFWVGNSELDCGQPGHRLRAARAYAHGAWMGRRPSYIPYVGRALIGARANTALRERLRSRSAQPAWLAALSGTAREPVGGPAKRSG